MENVPIYSGNCANIRKKNCPQLCMLSSARRCNQQLFPSQIGDQKSGLKVEQNYLHCRPISEAEGLQLESGGNDQVISKLDESEVKLKTFATKDAFIHADLDTHRGNKCVIVFVLL